ncbi:MAG: T9SS type A sorting domain-containing protein [Candidatus Marinimicrobia bacterium]|nr:T9SS type A sorting domain-containing protein [Candidatus Neomarinimicrobiota bacterium]
MKFLSRSILPVVLIIISTQYLNASPPDWVDNPGGYEFTATISGGIILSENGEQMGDEGDMFAAFDDAGDVRGLGLMLFPPFGPYAGTPVFEVQLRSNAGGDLLSFKYYDASADAVLDIAETYEFVINDILGDVINPITFNIQEIETNAPDWVDCPGCYEFTATISGGIILSESGEQMGDDGDIFAAFDEDGNVRGVGLLLFPPFGPYEGTPVFEVQLRSNAEGDLISYKYYDASADAILDIVETYEFVINDILGDVMNPIIFNIGSIIEECVDNDAALAPFDCAMGYANWGCDFLWGGVPISELCPVTCDACPAADVYGCMDSEAANYNPDATIDDGTCEYPCFDDDASVAPFTCGYAVTTWGCDFLWGGTPIGELCPESCGNCGGSDIEGCMNDTACNYNPDATIEDGSCLELDCAGECGGSAEIDECGICGGDGIPPWACDCNNNVDLGCGCGEAGPSGCDNVCGSTLENDACGVCGGDGSDDLGCGCFEPGPSGCDNVCGSTLENDACGVCGGDGSDDLGCGCFEPGPSGCDNVCGSTLENDACGVCGGDGSDDLGCGCFEPGPSGCDNVCGSTLELDECGVCGGNGIPQGACDCDENVEDCAGVCGGSSVWATMCEDTDGDGLGNPGSESQECIDGGRDITDGCDLPDLNLFLGEDGSVYYQSSEEIGGFQFNVDGATASSASGGDAGDAGFMVSTGGSMVIGFSLTGATFGPGCGTLTQVNLDGSATGLSGIVVSDATGNAIPFIYYAGGSELVLDCSDEYPDCAANEFDCAGECGGSAVIDECGVCGGDGVQQDCGCGSPGEFGIPDGDCDCDGNELDCADVCGGSSIWATMCEDTDGDGLGNPGSESQECIDGGRDITDGCDLPDLNLFLGEDGSVYYQSSEEIGGFQFNVDGATASSASGGDAGDAGFMVSTGGSMVIGFSLTGATFGPGCGTLTQVNLDGSATGLSGIVVSDATGNAIPFIYYAGGSELVLDCSDEYPDCADNFYDCAGDCGGSAELDACGVCGGDGSDDLGCGCFEPGPSGCDNVCGSTLENDDCGVCGGDNSSCADCAGVPNGDSWESDCGCVAADNSGDDCDDCAGVPNGDNIVDNCGTCDNDYSNDCVQDCAGEWGGSAYEDNCGVCDADPSNDNAVDLGCGCFEPGPSGCDNECGSTLENDDCDVCGGDNSTCSDCEGVPNGDSWESDCGCVAGNNSGDDCDDCAGVPNGPNVEDMCGTCDDDSSNDCLEDCFGVWGGTDYDQGCGCGVYDELPTDGCDDVCGSTATEDECGTCDDDSSNDCVEDCFGVWGGTDYDQGCGCGVYDELPTDGCDDVCGSTAELDDCGVCEGGNADMDCAGECFGTAEIDECGVCGGPGEIECWDGTFVCDTADCPEESTTIDYCLDLHSGANLISFYGLPDDVSITHVMSSIEGNATGVIGEGVAANYNGVEWMGSLNNISSLSGYWVIVSEAGSLCIEDGNPTDPAIQYSLHSGANLISFPVEGSVGISSSLPDDIEGFVSGIIGEGVAANNQPPWQGSLSALSGGNGYWMITTENISFSFDVSTMSRIKYDEDVGLTAPDNNDIYQSTQQAFYFIEDIILDGMPVSNGDWILTYNGKTLVGARQWKGTFTDIPAMGYDGAFETEGYSNMGSMLTFKVQQNTTGKVYQIMDVVPAWKSNEIFTLGQLAAREMPDEVLLVSAYPNPFNPVTNITFGIENDAVVMAKVIDINGREVAELANGVYSAGYHVVNWNADSHSSGLYFLTIVIDDFASGNGQQFVQTQKLMLLK